MKVSEPSPVGLAGGAVGNGAARERAVHTTAALQARSEMYTGAAKQPELRRGFEITDESGRRGLVNVSEFAPKYPGFGAAWVA
ncbi:hypothetical protein FGB62_369g01 [Gracilaria domingensis]|nr:hypothetical protein FGB62_369g01 [Gracilaria domingensis]